jgi:1,2-diacylglycerol 3-alpha-glucosyltransferase/glucuronosyltransferase
MRLMIVTDAWSPQVNGVVVTLVNTVAELKRLGHTVELITPAGFRTIPMPSYPEIPLAMLPGREVARRIDAFAPDAVHIATEGPLGIAARRHCLRIDQPFTTAYHTQFPEYVHARCRLPVAVTYAWLRHFHARSRAVMCGTPAIRDRLAGKGFKNLVLWSRGVDTTLFTPAPRDPRERERPIFLYVGRVAVEKNIEAFCELVLPGTKWVVGDGPARTALQSEFPDVRFFGTKHGRELAAFYQQADVFVFPSRTDTFGLVLIEAMACGTPVAAFPVTGPLDVVTDPSAGVLSEDLRSAALAALDCDRDAVRRFGQRFSWESATRQFAMHLQPRMRTGAMNALLDAD